MTHPYSKNSKLGAQFFASGGCGLAKFVGVLPEPLGGFRFGCVSTPVFGASMNFNWVLKL